MRYGAVDIGGTKIKYGIVLGDGKIIYRKEIDTNANMGGKKLLKTIVKLIEELLKEEPNLVGIGVSSAGQIDNVKGKVVYATDSIPGWTGMEIKKEVEKVFSIYCKVENDVNCMAMGEKWLGAGRKSNNFICVTLGTGIGGAVVINNKLFTGNNFLGGEFGHIQMVKDGKLCSCGNKGCFEEYASTKALVKLAEKKLNIKGLDGKKIIKEVKRENRDYIFILEEWIDYLTDGLRTLVHIFNPSLIVIGGGISGAGFFLLDLIDKSLNEKLIPSFKKDLKITFAECENDAGILGAVNLLIEELEK